MAATTGTSTRVSQAAVITNGRSIRRVLVFTFLGDQVDIRNCVQYISPNYAPYRDELASKDM